MTGCAGTNSRDTFTAALSFDAKLVEYCGTAYCGIGDRVRHRRHPELTGKVKAYEWNEPGRLGGIPYNIAWDDNSLAFDVLGMFWIDASDASVERIEEGTDGA